MLAAGPGWAQVPGVNGNGSAAAPAAPPAPTDPLGRETPAGMVAGFIAAAAEQNYERAAMYLDLSQEKDAWGPSVAQQLQRILDRGGLLYSRLRLSSEPQGDQEDGLAPDLEKFGLVRTDHGTVDLLAQRVDSKDGVKIWLVSARTVSELPELSRTVLSSWVDRLLPYALRDEYRIAGAPVGHWLAVLVLAVLVYGAIWLITGALGLLVFRLRKASGDSRFRRVLSASALPVRLFLTAWALRVAMVLAGVSIVARQHMSGVTEFLAWVALSWIVWRVVDALAAFAIDRMTLRGRLSMLSAVTFIRRSVKFVIIAFAIIAGLNAFGYNVTAGLAALGIGGIAIALGAQKTIEHLVGSLTLVTDQPMRVGDFCKFGETMGTIEDIGMRSTRIRTLDRTVVTVPNGQLAAVQIENYSRRDKFWFHPVLDLRYETTPDQIRALIASLRQMLLDHPKVDDDPARVRFIGLGATSLRVEIFSYVHAVSMDEFLEVQEELNLRIMELVAEAGSGFAFPSQTVYVTRDKGVAVPTEQADATQSAGGPDGASPAAAPQRV
ncbi:mechanosensitive ion channel family protein [Rhodopseudomonas palustris]|uniref:mechanosensitive ion channel family protein n=1 Tax=Rhodopseudomonas palustris TaxID=1076 RepID=UPI0006426952|nr:mechanosensitive ion channel family protein [Rhodopseudomonas palustris]QDM00236.1 mechanosensitive ion channel family protein [Rhodopseudomonas palustris]